ncbi:MAG: DUF445 domain-containing protein [Chloroflexota bacterium]
MIELANDINKQADLEKMKRRATALFWLVTAVFFLATLWVRQYPWLSYVQATAEAAMVGALADWFAVTALFRHPLGLKIPHTAIIPQRKDSIAENFGQFVQANFLTEEVIADKLRSMDLARQAALWLSRPDNSRHIANHVAAGLTAMVQVVNDEDILVIIEHGVVDRVRSTHFAPLLGKTLPLVIAGSRHQELLYGSLKLVTHVVEENKAEIQAKISEETPWWMPRIVDQAIYRKIIKMLDQTVQEVRTNPDHPLHAQFVEVINQFVENLENSPDILVQEEALKEEFLEHPAVQEFSSSLWQDLKRALLEYGSNPDSGLRQPVQQGLARFGQALRQDRAMLDKINRWVEELARYLIRVYGYEAGQLITSTIHRWDAEATSRKVELHIGRDLQFIRINGTLVGGLVGLGIHILSQLMYTQ